MYSFFVLGIIPGTNIQISFGMWLAMAVTLLTAAALIRRGFKRTATNPATEQAA